MEGKSEIAPPSKILLQVLAIKIKLIKINVVISFNVGKVR